MLEQLANLFKSFGSVDKQSNGWDQWNKLETRNEVEKLIENSYQRPQLIFKFSPRCSVSKLVEDRIAKLEDDLKSEGVEVELHAVDVIQASSLSQHISQAVEVRHESPQVLILSDGEVTWDASHMMIKNEKIINALKPR